MSLPDLFFNENYEETTVLGIDLALYGNNVSKPEVEAIVIFLIVFSNDSFDELNGFIRKATFMPCNEIKTLHADLYAKYIGKRENITSVFLIEKIENFEEDILDGSLLRQDLNKFKQFFPIIRGYVNERLYDDKIMKPSQIIKKLEKIIMNQSEAIKKISFQVYRYLLYLSEERKKDFSLLQEAPTLLFSGATGTGKSAMINAIVNIFNADKIQVDCNNVNASGYYGNSIDVELYNKYSRSNKSSRFKILVLEEIDKLINYSSLSIYTKVLDQILILLSERRISVQVRGENNEESHELDFHDFLIICVGNFSKVSGRNHNTKIQGFSKLNETKKHDEEENFIAKTLGAEAYGRINAFIYFKEHSREDLKNILLKSAISPLKYISEFYSKHGKTFSVTDKEVDEIIDLSYKNNTGVRSLSQILVTYFENEMIKIADNYGSNEAIKLNKNGRNIDSLF